MDNAAVFANSLDGSAKCFVHCFIFFIQFFHFKPRKPCRQINLIFSFFLTPMDYEAGANVIVRKTRAVVGVIALATLLNSLRCFSLSDVYITPCNTFCQHFATFLFTFFLHFFNFICFLRKKGQIKKALQNWNTFSYCRLNEMIFEVFYLINYFHFSPCL